MKNQFLFFLAFFICLSHTASAQVSQSFETQTTTQTCTSTACNYTDLLSASIAHELVNAGGIPVNAMTNTSVNPNELGFRSFFTPTRTGGSITGLTDGDFFGYAGSATINNNVSQTPTDGSQAFIAEDTDGEVMLLFDPVRLTGGGTFSMDYIVDGSFESSDGADDYLYIALNITDCGNPANNTTLVLVEAFGAPAAGQLDLDDITDGMWNSLSENLISLSGCTAELEIIMDSNSSTEEFAFDNIEFSAGLVLPVEFVAVTATAREKDIEVSWSTASEDGNRGFSVERSTDGIDFSPIGWVDGVGTTNEEQHYRFADENATAGMEYYYRLRQEDFDGTFAYSDIRVTRMLGSSATAASRLFPNPTVNGQTTLEVFTEQPSAGEVTVFDISGRQVLRTEQPFVKGSNRIQLNLSQLNHGAYLVRVAGAGKAEVLRLTR